MESDNTTMYIVSTVLTATIAGIGWLVKRYFAKRDEDKAAMKQDIANLQADLKKTKRNVKKVAGLIIGCEHTDCPNKAALKQFWDEESDDL